MKNEPQLAWYKNAKDLIGSTEFSVTPEDQNISDRSAAFINHVMDRSGISGTKSVNAKSFLDWGQKLDRFVPGCVVVFWRVKPSSDRGFVAIGCELSSSGKHVQVIGDSTNGPIATEWMSVQSVLGYRWPSGAKIPV